MMRISTLLTALAVALAASTLATPSLAQRSEGMSANRAQALINCNAQAGKYKQYVWGATERPPSRACTAQRGQQKYPHPHPPNNRRHAPRPLRPPPRWRGRDREGPCNKIDPCSSPPPQPSPASGRGSA